jgi:hypothetical protein
MRVFSALRDRSARGRLVGALVVWLVGGSAAAKEVPAVTVLDSEDATVGALPSGFQAALTGGGGPVAWSIQEDASSAAGPKVLVQTSRDETSKRFPLCVYEPFSARDVDLAVRFKPISGKVDQAAGLVFRYRDSSNYYIVRANALEGNVVLYKVEDGRRSDLKPVDAGLFAYGKKAPVPGQTWGVLRVVARGGRFSVHLNGSHLFDVEDATFSDAGRVGLWTKADSVTAFDELRIKSLDGGGR